MRNILPPSPFRSVWTFIVYCLTLSTPIWKLLSYLGNVDLVADYADSIGKVLAHPLGMWIPVIVGFGLLMWLNHKERQESNGDAQPQSTTLPRPGNAASQPTSSADTDSRQAQEAEVEQLKAKLEESKRENRRLARQLTSQSSSGVIGATLTHAEIPEEMLSSKRVRQLNFYLEQLLALADEGPRLTGWTFEGCTIIGPAVVFFTDSIVTDSEVQGSPDTVLYEVDAYGDEAVGIIRIDRCTFQKCTFGRIGLAGTSADQQWLRHNFAFTLP